MLCATHLNCLQHHLESKFGDRILFSKIFRDTGKKSVTVLFNIIYLVRKDTSYAVIKKKKKKRIICIFVWFATPKIVKRNKKERGTLHSIPYHVTVLWCAISLLEDYRGSTGMLPTGACCPNKITAQLEDDADWAI